MAARKETQAPSTEDISYTRWSDSDRPQAVHQKPHENAPFITADLEIRFEPKVLGRN